MANKKVCIIVLNYNGLNYLDDCFLSLSKINYPKEFYKVLVVDNASTDGSAEIIEKNFPWAQILKNKENFGFAKGNNIGINWAIENNFDYIYLLNNDTVVEPNFLAEAVSVFETDEKAGSVQSRIMLWDNKELLNSYGNQIHYLGFGFCGGFKEKYDSNKKYDKYIPYPSGAGVLLKAEILKQIGLFDEDYFMYSEDLDLGARIILAGYKNIFAEKSVVYHKYSFSKSIKKYYFMERNRFLFLFENLKVGTLFVFFPALFFMEIGTFFFSLFSGWWREKLMVYKYFFKEKTWDQISIKRDKVKNIRKVDDRILVEYFTGKISYQEPEMKNWVLEKIANPIFNAYFVLIKHIVFW